jgi:hypothetical protein
MSTQCDYLPEKTAGMELLGNSQEGGIVAKRMPADAFLDSNPLGDWSNVLAQNGLSPVRPLSPVAPAGEKTII